MIQLDIRSRTKKSDSDGQGCQESDSDSTQKPLTPYDSVSATLLTSKQNLTTVQVIKDSACPNIAKRLKKGICGIAGHFCVCGIAGHFCICGIAGHFCICGISGHFCTSEV